MLLIVSASLVRVVGRCELAPGVEFGQIVAVLGRRFDADLRGR
jgi:hypothetical protein